MSVNPYIFMSGKFSSCCGKQSQNVFKKMDFELELITKDHSLLIKDQILTVRFFCKKEEEEKDNRY